MKWWKKKVVRKRYETAARVGLGVFLLSSIITTGVLTALMQSQLWLYQTEVVQEDFTSFPVGVNPQTKTIAEQPLVDNYRSANIATAIESPGTLQPGWWKLFIQKLSQLPAVQNLASPSTRVLVIWPGERREQVVDHFGDVLGWGDAERILFETLVTAQLEELNEGMFLPGRYIVNRSSTPQEVADLLNQRFTDEVLLRYPASVAEQVPLEDALIIASLLEREAYDFTDMRVISGVIWNRLFVDMKLQIDATLQYVRGSKPYEPSWWPVPRPRDKFLSSPFNTYENPGLPPAPIGNPSPEALLAALNPRLTDCLFYFHDTDGSFYCNPTYEEHVAELREIYGQDR
ncbi:MAG: endolytic transglycosylase MltG [Patescibacteria group bacterium]